MDVGCFNNIIGKLCENGMLADAEKLFEEMETKSVLPDVYTYTYLVDSCFKEGRVEDAIQYFYKMADGREHGPKFNIGFFNRMFSGLTEADRVDDALKVYRRMPDKEIKPNIITFEILVKALCKQGDLDQARDLVMDMARGAVVPSSEFRESVVDIFKKADRQEEIEKAFEEKPAPTPLPRTDYRPHNAVGTAQVKQPSFSSAPAVQPGIGYSQQQQLTFSDTQNQQHGYVARQPAQKEFGSPQPSRPQFGASQGVPGYGNKGNQYDQFGPAGEQKIGSYPPPQVGYGAQLPQSGNRIAPPAYVASGQPSHGTYWSHSGYESSQRQLHHGAPQWQQHTSQLPHNQTSFGMPQAQNNNGFPGAQVQSNFAAHQVQTAVVNSYGKPRNDISEDPTRFGTQTNQTQHVGPYEYNPEYRSFYNHQEFEAPNVESKSVVSKDQPKSMVPEDQQHAAF